MKEKVLEAIRESKPIAAPKGHSSSIVLTNSEILDRTIWSHESMLCHLYEQQQLVELHLQGIQKRREELTTLIEELKKTKVQEVIFSTLEGEDIEGEYIDPLPSLDLTTSLDSKPRTEPSTKDDSS